MKLLAPLFLFAACLAGVQAQDLNVNGVANGNPDLNVIGTDISVFTGVYGQGSTLPAAYANGTHLLWYPRKAAFRVGYTFASTWADSLIGDHSVGLLGNSTASGFGSVAISGSSIAANAVSIGLGSNANADYAIAMGIGIASGPFSFAVFGTAAGEKSVALRGGTALGNQSIAMGDYATAVAYGSTVVGQYNELTGSTTTTVATDPIFVVGTGTGTATNQRKNGFEVRRNGEIRMVKQGDILMGEFGQSGD